MSWISVIGAIAELILELIAQFKKKEVQDLGIQLKNAKTVAEKQAVARAISEHFYSN